MGRVLVVGAGLTGAVTASLLRARLSRKCQIHIWDKSAETGGRMCTKYSVTNDCGVDLGAQYITATADNYRRHKTFYEDLLDEGVLTPLVGRIDGEREAAPATRHFVPPRGMASLVEHFVQKAGVTVEHECPVESLDIDDGHWLVNRPGDGRSATFDCVILTVPVPDALRIKGHVQTVLDNLPDVKARLSQVTYTCRFALGLFYKPGVSVELPWCAKYFYDQDCIRFVAEEKSKRGSDVTGRSVVVHTSVPYAIRHLEESVGSVCTDRILPAVLSIVPQLPPPDQLLPHFWPLSQVSHCYEGQPGAVVLHERPLLVVGGDAFTNSTFDGCLDSAVRTAELVCKNFTS